MTGKVATTDSEIDGCSKAIEPGGAGLLSSAAGAGAGLDAGANFATDQADASEADSGNDEGVGSSGEDCAETGADADAIEDTGKGIGSRAGLVGGIVVEI